MKIKPFLCAAALLSACATPQASVNDEVKEVVESFFNAADNHDYLTLDSLLHPEFRMVVTRPDMEPQTLDKDEYMALMMIKLIGGKPRRIDEISTRVSGDRALSHVKLEGPYAKFDAMQTFVRCGGSDWCLIHSLTQYDPKS